MIVQTYLAEYHEGGQLKATSFEATDIHDAETQAFFDDRAPVVVGRKTD